MQHLVCLGHNDDDDDKGFFLEIYDEKAVEIDEFVMQPPIDCLGNLSADLIQSNIYNSKGD